MAAPAETLDDVVDQGTGKAPTPISKNPKFKHQDPNMDELMKQLAQKQEDQSPLEKTVEEQYKPATAAKKLWDLAKLSPFLAASMWYAGWAPVMMGSAFIISNVINKAKEGKNATWYETYQEFVKGVVFGPAAYLAYSYVNIIDNTTLAGKIKRTLFFNPFIVGIYILPFNMYTYAVDKLKGAGNVLKGLVTGETYRTIYQQIKNDELKWGSTTYQVFKTFAWINALTLNFIENIYARIFIGNVNDIAFNLISKSQVSGKKEEKVVPMDKYKKEAPHYTPSHELPKAA